MTARHTTARGTRPRCTPPTPGAAADTTLHAALAALGIPAARPANPTRQDSPLSPPPAGPPQTSAPTGEQEPGGVGSAHATSASRASALPRSEDELMVMLLVTTWRVHTGRTLRPAPIDQLTDTELIDFWADPACEPLPGTPTPGTPASSVSASREPVR
ncbi:hypothetical protein GCM10010411_74520 [Actinomadura fulvescens]|uniref:Uncharacterized protein n=1 Tax=Actinomadura fulvescens TaxID=46160 RepID=A0ABN3QHF6_9ACTN